MYCIFVQSKLQHENPQKYGNVPQILTTYTK